MLKKSDDSIERIFRQALTRYEDNTFRASDWLKMEKMLDEEAARKAAARSSRNKGIAFTLLGLTGLIIAVYFLAFKNPSVSIGRLNDSRTGTQAEGDFSENGNVSNENSSDGLLSKSPATDSAMLENDLKEHAKPEDFNEQRLDSDGSNKQREATRSQMKNQSLKEGVKNSAAKNNPTSTPKKNISENPNTTNRTPAVNIQPASSDGKINTSGGGQMSLQTSRRQNKIDGVDTSATEKATSAEKNDIDIESKSRRTQSGVSNKAEEILPFDNSIENKSALKESAPTIISNVKAGERGQVTPFDQANLTQQSESILTDSLPKKSDVPTSDKIISADQSASEPSSSSNTSTTNSDSVSNDLNKIQQEADAVENSLAEEEKKKLIPGYRWSVGILFAPEFSTTSLDKYSTPGESIGLRIGYQISNRFTVNTGFIRSNKKYIGDGDEYSPRNSAYWQNRTNGIIPEEIDSKCLVYELPIGIQFDAIQTKKLRLFFSASLSSYFMASQAYDYRFDSPNPGADTGWRSPGSESYWFNVAGISAGYERYIYPSLAVGIEPYLKVSLSEIGWPNVKLFSTGAYLTVRYRFKTKNFTE